MKGTCEHCGKRCGEEDPIFPRGGKPDPCLGVIPGVIHACCGHGETFHAYVVFANADPGAPCATTPNVSLYKERALRFFDLLGTGPNNLSE